MTTTTWNRPHGDFKVLRNMIIIIMAAVLFAVCTHALQKHGSEARVVDACVQRGGTILQKMNPATGRIALVCQIGPEMFGIEIQSCKGNVITCFLKNKMKRLAQVDNYLSNAGYTEVKVTP